MSHLPASGEAGQLESEPVTMMLAEHFELRSSLHDAPFRIWVSLPLQPAPAQGHAVLYLFDARSYFTGASEMVRIMSVSQEIAPLVVVGIGYDDPSYEAQVRRRTHDLTITAGSPVATALSSAGNPCTAGGAPALLRFIDEELKPFIRSRYRTDASREILAGHSLGGLTTLYAALTRPDGFFGYIACSPAIFADKEAIAEALELSAARAAPARLYVGVGQAENHQISRMVDEVEALAATLSSPRFSHLDALIRILGHETHATAIYAALSQSLRWMLRDVPVDTAFDLTKFRP